MAENYLPPVTFGRYGQRVSKKLLGIEQQNYYKEDMTYGELGGRALGIRRFNEEAEIKKKLKDAKNLKIHKDKEENADKVANAKEFNETFNKLATQSNKIGFNLGGANDMMDEELNKNIGFKLE